MAASEVFERPLRRSRAARRISNASQIDPLERMTLCNRGMLSVRNHHEFVVFEIYSKLRCAAVTWFFALAA